MAIYVRVQTGGDIYALPVHQVQEVGDLGKLTSVPGAKPAALGVCNLRGEILPVFDLAAVLGTGDATHRRRLAVVEANEQRIGLAVDDVVAVTELDGATEKTASTLLAGSTLVDDTKVEFLNLFVMMEVLRVDATR